MAVPAEADFRYMFPELAEFDGTLVRQAMLAAQSFADEVEWLPQDYPLALLYMAAHIAIQLKQAAEDAAASAASSGVAEGTYVSSVSFGDRTVSFRQMRDWTQQGQQDGASTVMKDLHETFYGQLYVNLRMRNIIPVFVV